MYFNYKQASLNIIHFSFNIFTRSVYIYIYKVMKRFTVKEKGKAVADRR